MEFEIKLNDLHFRAHHGVYEQEKKVGNEFVVDVMVLIPVNNSISNDILEDSISYADIYDVVRKEMKNSRNLLEKVALEIKNKLIANHPIIKGGKITITKLSPPLSYITGNASVSLNF